MLIPLKKKYLLGHPSSSGRYTGRTGNSNGRIKSRSIWKLLQEQAKKKGRK